MTACRISRSRVRWRTATGPMPVMISRSGRRPWRIRQSSGMRHLAACRTEVCELATEVFFGGWNFAGGASRRKERARAKVLAQLLPSQQGLASSDCRPSPFTFRARARAALRSARRRNDRTTSSARLRRRHASGHTRDGPRHGIADHVGWALLAFRAARHFSPRSTS